MKQLYFDMRLVAGPDQAALMKNRRLRFLVSLTSWMVQVLSFRFELKFSVIAPSVFLSTFADCGASIVCGLYRCLVSFAYCTNEGLGRVSGKCSALLKRVTLDTELYRVLIESRVPGP